MRMPYADDPQVAGVEVMTQAQINAWVGLAAAHGIQVVTHGIGNLGIDRIMAAYEKVLPAGANPLRHSIIHVQITDREQLERMADDHIIAQVQPIFLQYDLHIVEERVGAALASTSYAFKTMRELGIHATYGTDSPIETLSALNCIHCAVNRQDLHHQPAGGFYPAECVSVEDAVDAYTALGAHNTFEEDVKGRLLPGYYADLVVLSADIFTIPHDQILDVQVDMTMVDGQVVYERATDRL
jgi:predicted amidohydrolase YtcJ